MQMPTGTHPREPGIQELDDLSGTPILDILYYVRLLHHQTRNLTSEERFDRLWLHTRRITPARGIAHEDIEPNVATAPNNA